MPEWESAFIILGFLTAILSLVVIILVWAFSKQDADIKSLSIRLDSANQRVDSMHNLVASILRSKTG